MGRSDQGRQARNTCCLPDASCSDGACWILVAQYLFSSLPCICKTSFGTGDRDEDARCTRCVSHLHYVWCVHLCRRLGLVSRIVLHLCCVVPSPPWTSIAMVTSGGWWLCVHDSGKGDATHTHVWHIAHTAIMHTQPPHTHTHTHTSSLGVLFTLAHDSEGPDPSFMAMWTHTHTHTHTLFGRFMDGVVVWEMGW